MINSTFKGEEENICARLAEQYKARGLDYNETLILCLKRAGQYSPVYSEKEVEKCVKSLYGYPVGDYNNQANLLAQAKEATLRWLKLSDPNVIDIILSIVVANEASGDPVWLLIIGAPSTGKSEILRGLFNCRGVHYLGGFTANTFASGFDRSNVGLLERLPSDVTLVIKDFGTLLSMRHEDKSLVLQQLREIYDGEYKKEFGNGKIVHWKGRIGLLGASTTAIENYHGVIGELGNRYLLYRCELDDACREEVAKLALNKEGEEQQMRQEITESFKKVLENAPKAEQVNIPDDLRDKISSLANLASRLRSPVNRNSYDKSVNYTPDIEGPARLAKAFAKLGKGLSAVRGKADVTELEYEVIKRVAIDTVPKRRIEIVQYLMGSDWKRTKAVSNDLNIPQITSTKELEDLMMVGVLNREADINDSQILTQTTPYKWKLKEEISKLILKTELFAN